MAGLIGCTGTQHTAASLDLGFSPTAIGPVPARLDRGFDILVGDHNLLTWTVELGSCLVEQFAVKLVGTREERQPYKDSAQKISQARDLRLLPEHGPTYTPRASVCAYNQVAIAHMASTGRARPQIAW